MTTHHPAQPPTASAATPGSESAQRFSGPPNIADDYDDLLGMLSRRKRLGMIAWLSVGFYDGWRPSRSEVADLVAVELGR
jgi:hypothetical protein